jgi:hypothetical protein
VNPARVVASVRLLWGVVLLAAPKAVFNAANASHERSSPRARGVVLILGARNLTQSVVELCWPTRVVLTLATLVDAVHAVSFLGLIALNPHARWRRAVLLNVLTALGFCAATGATARSARTFTETEVETEQR